MTKARYIGFDFETGGLDPSKSPGLTAYFCALDKDLNILGDLDLKIRPEAPFDTIEQGAMDVNKINLTEHNLIALSREDAGKALVEFLTKFGGTGKRDKDRPKPMGHNIAFDIGFVKQIISQDEWEKRVHYSTLCTSTLTSVFKDAGVLPDSVGNLSSLVKYFDIKMLTAHEAKSDVLMMVEVYGKLIQMIKNSTGGSGASIDILTMLEK